MSQVSIIDIEGNHPEIPTIFDANVGFAIPIANTLEILSEVVSAGSVPTQTVGSGNTITINIQRSQAIASADASKIGLAAFDSASFNVDANGFVSLIGSGLAVDFFTPDTGTSPVVPNGTGNVGISGTGNLQTVGGTNNLSIRMLGSQGDIIYANTTNTFKSLSKNTTATRYLANTGTDNNPKWDQVNLANGTTGTLPVASGGTGSTGITGIVSGDGTAYNGRTLQQPAAGITISNANGSSGNPTLALANDLAAVEGLSGTGIAARTASDTWALRTLTGTAGEIAVTNGDGVSGNPTISLDTAVGSMVLIETQTASNVASLDFTSGITSTYDNYFFTCTNVVPATNGAGLWVQLSIDGGSTFLASGYQSGSWNSFYNSATLTNANATSLLLTIAGSANTASRGVCGNGYLYGLPGSGYKYGTSNGIAPDSATGEPKNFYSSGVQSTASAVDAVRFKFNAGNITSGTISLYGIRKA